MIETEYNILMRQVELLKKENEKLRKVAEAAIEHVCDYREIYCHICEALKEWKGE